ncbi:MAG: hypothetical protein IPK98_03615 [Chloracidobacterium sp.]|nr:hypothetical protein [Chloracidobacterium sp.]
METLLSTFDRRFTAIDSRSRELLELIPDHFLYKRPRETRSEMAPFSCGEYILRSAAMVEKTFGGITTRLWDDPFEWTLPEKLVNKELIFAYLDEVEATRVKGFAFFTSDGDLKKRFPPRKRFVPWLISCSKL